jgi:hypothetical protein
MAKQRKIGGGMWLSKVRKNKKGIGVPPFCSRYTNVPAFLKQGENNRYSNTKA